MAGKKDAPQRRDLTRRKILDKARKLFLAKGLAGLSMRKLAKELGYTPGALYKHFDSKEEILQAIRARTAGRWPRRWTSNCRPGWAHAIC
jgi:AcrR family transcriptional regulator